MKLTSREQIFGFATAEMWNEFQHIRAERCARLGVEIDELGFMLVLRWEQDGQHKTATQRFTSFDMSQTGMYMTSWLRTFIAQSGINK